jgi:RNA polymerase sigma-70 factor (ECF subfamily)
LDEKQLIEQARGGSQAAWTELVRLHQQALFRFAYLRMGDADEAEDATQEALIRAYRHLRRFDTGRPLRPWLFSIVNRVASNRRRALGRYWSAVLRWAGEQVPTVVAEPEADGQRRLDQASVWQAIQGLNAMDQSIIYLRYFLEFSVEEGAQALGIAEGTVKSRTSRALARLEVVIEKEFPGLIEGSTT